MANGPEVARAYVTIIPSMQGAQAAITTGLTGASDKAGAAAGAAAGTSMSKGMAGKLQKATPAAFSALGVSTAGSMADGFTSTISKAGIPGAVAAVGAAAAVGLYKVGESFDDMTDTIRVGTGATGEALDALTASAINVGQVVPSSFEDVGQTVADLNTRLGITGEGLETLASQFLEAGNILGTSIDVNKVTASFNAFRLSEEDMSDAMDDLFTVSQATGIGMNELAQSVTSNAPAMQSLGFSFQDTASMAGLLDKAGINASSTFSKMSKGLVTLAKDGEEPAEAFQRTVEEIDGLIQKGDEAAALNLASEIFGTKGAAQFIGAIQTGALSIDEMNAALAENNDAIMTTAADTHDFAESWAIVKNNLLAAIEPLASGVFSAVGAVFSAIVPVVQMVADAFQAFGSAAQTDGGILSTLTGIMQSVVDFITPILIPVVQTLGTIFHGVFTAIGSVVSVHMNAIKTVINTVMSVIKGDWKGAWEGIKNFFSSTFDTINSLTGGKLGEFYDKVVGKVAAVRDKVKAIIDKIKGFFHFNVEKPNIPLPHFKITPDGWKIGDLLKGIKPHLSLDWYATGGIFDGAQVIGVGEKGPEAVLPLTAKGLEPFAAALSDQMNGGATVYNIGDVNIEARDLEDMNTIEQFVEMLKRTKRAYA